MRPSLWHQHTLSDDYFPGDDDVHGVHPRPRAHEFDRAPGQKLLAYVDFEVEEALTDATSIYRVEYDRLARESIHIEFKFVNRSHWIYEEAPTSSLTPVLVAWWRRPRQFSRQSTIFPWIPDDGDRSIFMLFDANTLLPVVRVRLLMFDQEDGRAATGWVALEFISIVSNVPGISADFERVYNTNNVDDDNQ